MIWPISVRSVPVSTTTSPVTVTADAAVNSASIGPTFPPCENGRDNNPAPATIRPRYISASRAGAGRLRKRRGITRLDRIGKAAQIGPLAQQQQQVVLFQQTVLGIAALEQAALHHADTAQIKPARQVKLCQRFVG